LIEIQYLINLGFVRRFVHLERIAYMPFRILLFLIGVVCILYFLLFLFLKSEEGVQFVSRKLKEVVKDISGVEIRLESVRMDIFNAELNLNQFILPGRDNVQFASVKGLSVSLSLPYLLFGKIVISNFSVDGLDLNLIIENGKIVNLPVFPEPRKGKDVATGSGELPDITVEKISVSNVNVHLKYEDIVDGDMELQELSGSYVSRSAEAVISNLAAKVKVKGEKYNLLLNARAGYLSDTVILHSLEIDLDKNRLLTLKGEIKNLSDPVFKLDTELNLPLAYLKNYPVNMRRAEGNLLMKCHLKGKIDAPIGDCNISGSNVIIEQFRIGNFEGNVVYDNGDIQLNRFNIDNFGNRLTVNATGGVKDRIGLVGNVKIERLELAELLRNIGVNSIVMLEIKGLIEFSFAIDNQKEMIIDAKPVLSVKGPTIFSDYYFSPRRGEPVFNLRAANLSGEVSITDKGVRLKSVEITTEKSRVLVRNSFIGFTGDGYMDLRATSSQMDFSDITPIAGLDIRGVSSLNATIKGPFPSLRISGDIDARGFSFEHFYGGSVRLYVEFFNNFLSFKNISGRLGDSVYSGDVILNMSGAPDIDLNAEIKEANLKNLLSSLPSNLRIDGIKDGRATLSVRLNGPVNSLSGDIKTVINRLSLFNEEIDRINASLRLDNNNLEVLDASISLLGGEIKASGRIQVNGDLNFITTIKGVRLERSSNLQGLPVKFSGGLNGDIKVGGNTQEPEVEFSGNIEDLRSLSERLGVLYIKAGLKGSLYNVNAHLDSGRVTLNLKNSLENLERYTIEVALKDIDLSKFFIDRPEISTLEDIDATFYGNTKTGDFDGDILVKSIQATLYDMNFKLRRPVNITLRRGEIDFSDIDIFGEDINLNIKAAQFNPSALNINGSGTVSLKLLQGITKNTISASGSLNLSFNLQGSVERPDLTVDGYVPNTLLKLSFFPHPFENTSIRFFMQKDLISISELKGNLAGGSFEGGGSIRLKGYVPENFDVRVDIKKAFLSFPKELPSLVSGYITINGDINRLLLGGEIDIEKATYGKNIDFNTLLVDLTRKKPKYTSYSRENEFVFFDIGLRAPSGIVVKNNIVTDSEFRADLRLVGSNERIGIIGTVNAMRAKMVLSGNEYTLKRGIVQLTERYRIAYNVDFLLSTVCHDTNTGIDHNIDMSITGSDENITIHYKDNTSPPFSETDIVTCLALGSTPQKVSGQDKGSQQESFGLISSVVGVDQKLKDIIPIPIETFRISSKYSDTLRMNVPQVQVSWKLLPNLRLNYSSSLIYSQDQKIELDYRLNQKTSLRTQWNSQAQVPVGNLGVDIKWSWEF
jgi:hypothetical protein